MGSSRKFPNGEIVIVSGGNCKKLQGFRKNIYFCKGFAGNFSINDPNRGTLTFLLIPAGIGTFIETFGMGVGLEAFGGECAVPTMLYHNLYHLNVESVSLISSEQRFGFQFCLVFTMYFSNTLFCSLMFTFSLLICYKTKPFYKGKVKGNEGKRKHIAEVRISQNKPTCNTNI